MASNQEVDYQLGAHDIDTSGSIVDDDDVVEFEFEAGAVFRRLADDIYESPEAGIREPLTNSITSIRRTFDKPSEDGVIKITVQDGDQVMLRLRDNGEGISKAVLNEVLTVVGRSNARDDGQLSGQYGMGFLASYKLVGMNGGFIMCTNPRDSNDGPYSGLFKPGAFEPDKDGSLPQYLGEDDYGTLFEYFVEDGITISQLREWVENHAKWSPVPVIYQELDEDGNEVYNEDFQASTITQNYGDFPSIHIETDYYEVATSPKADNDVVLISSPVSMRGHRTLRKSLPWSVDLRLKYENGIVIDGPNEGLIPVDKNQYDSMEEERQEKYISESDLENDDLCLPEPTGTRERLRKSREFLNRLNSKLHNEYLDIVEDTLDDFTPSNTALQDLDEMEHHVMMRIFSEFDRDKEYSTDNIDTTLSNTYNYDRADDDLLEFVQTMTENVSIVSESKGYNNQYPKKPAYELVMDDTDVYMCIAKGSWKIDAINSSEVDTDIIKVSNADAYEPFERHLGWTRVSDVKRDNVGELLSYSDDEVEDIIPSRKNSKPDDMKNRQITVHYMGGGRDTTKRTVDELINTYQDPPARYRDYLVLFSRTSGANVSDNYYLADNRCCVASCSNKEIELLESEDNIMRYEDYVSLVQETNHLTSNGYMSAEDIFRSNREVAIEIVKDISETYYADVSTLDKYSDYIGDENYQFDNSPLYVLMEKEEWKHIENNENNMDVNNEVYLLTGHTSIGRSKNRIHIDPLKMYVKANYSEEFVASEEVKTVIDSHKRVNTEFTSVIESLNRVYSETGTLSSMNEDENDVRLPRHTTKDGRLTIKEIYEEYEAGSVVVHVTDSSRISKFEKPDILQNMPEYLSDREFGKYDLTMIREDSLYVPLLDSEYEKIKEYVSSDTVVLGAWDYDNEKIIDVDDRYLYAGMTLTDWDSNTIRKSIGNASYQTAVNMVNSLEHLHKKGEEPM